MDYKKDVCLEYPNTYAALISMVRWKPFNKISFFTKSQKQKLLNAFNKELDEMINKSLITGKPLSKEILNIFLRLSLESSYRLNLTQTNINNICWSYLKKLFKSMIDNNNGDK